MLLPSTVNHPANKPLRGCDKRHGLLVYWVRCDLRRRF